MYEPLILAALEAARKLSVSERKFHALRKQDGFPQPIQLGPRCLRWRMSDLQGWLQSQPTVATGPEPEPIRVARDARTQAVG